MQGEWAFYLSDGSLFYVPNHDILTLIILEERTWGEEQLGIRVPISTIKKALAVKATDRTSLTYARTLAALTLACWDDASIYEPSDMQAAALTLAGRVWDRIRAHADELKAAGFNQQKDTDT